MLDVFDGILAARLCGAGGASPTPPAPVLIEKTVTANGTYNAGDDNANGYSAVTVAVPQLPVTFLKSIKTLGNSVILTDIVPDYNWDVFFDLKMENPVSTGAYEVLGVNYPTEHFLMTFPWYGGNTIDYLAWAGFTPSSGDTYGITGEISLQDEANKQNTAIMRRGRGGCIFGKHNYTMTNKTTDTAPSHPIVISGIDEGGTIYPYSRGELTIYGIRIFNEYGALIHDFVPAKAKSNSRAGLYDVITGTFYPSDPEHDDFIKEEVT